MGKILKYVFAESEKAVYNEYNYNKSPLIKVKNNKVIEPIEIDLNGLSLYDWAKDNPNDLVFNAPALRSKPGTKERPYYDSKWSLFELPLDYYEDFCIETDIKQNNSEFSSDLFLINKILNDLNKIFDYIEPDISNSNTFGLELRNLIILSATEVENHWTRLMLNNGYKKSRMNTKDYIKLAEFINFKYEFKLLRFPHYAKIKPFDSWRLESPTKSLDWYYKYNKIKHDRYSNLPLATLDNTLNVVAAVLTLMLIRYNEFNLANKLDATIFKISKKVRPSIFLLKKPYFEEMKEITFIKYFER